jgi:hypothetical protein
MKTAPTMIRFMATNEEYMRISVDTKRYLLEDVITKEIGEIQRPRIRKNSSNQAIANSQSVNKPVLYKAKINASFGNSTGNCTYTLKQGADVVIKAGQSVKFMPGFKAEAGAKLHASIDPSLKSAQVGVGFLPFENQRLTPDYRLPSENVGTVYSYGAEQANNLLNESTDVLVFFPNPAKNSIKLSGVTQSRVLQIFDTKGCLQMQTTIDPNNTIVNISGLREGVYFIKTIEQGISKTKKLIKL